MSRFEVIRGVEGCCLALDDTRIAGPKPWGGGKVIHAWETDETYKAIDVHLCVECAEGMGRYSDSLCDPLKQRISELEGQRDALLRCLENDYGIRASWDGLRRVWTTESVAAELDYIEDKSRWFKLFGTPERAARTLVNVCQFSHGGELCDRCRCYLFDSCDRTLRLGNEQKIYDALLEWLRGDA